MLAMLVLALAAACASPAGAPESTTTAAPATVSATSGVTAAASPSPGATDPPASATPAPAAPATPAAAAGDSVTIAAVGDVSLARQVVDRMEAQGAGYPYALIAPLMDADIGFANLEGALTDRGEPWPKGYNFRTPPRFAAGLIGGGFNVVTIANNHSMDYGATGLLDTVGALDAAGVQHAGAGANNFAARVPAIVERRGLRVAFLAYVATPRESGGFSIEEWAAGETTAGVSIGTPERITADVRAAGSVADFVIVAVHAGDEYRTTPSATQVALADAALAAGADAFIGAHAHVVQPIERRGRQLIAWGLGNFIFDLDNVDLANIPRPRVSLILKLTLTRGAGVTDVRIVPVTQDENEDRPRPATFEEAAALAQRTGVTP